MTVEEALTAAEAIDWNNPLSADEKNALVLLRAHQMTGQLAPADLTRFEAVPVPGSLEGL